jgi:hypothetical protein
MPEKKVPKSKKKVEKSTKVEKTKAKRTGKAAETEKASAVAVSEGRIEALRGAVTGKPSFIQSSYGIKGNFEVVVPLSGGGLAHCWRDNDSQDLAWHGPTKFGEEAGRIEGVSLIQSDFGERGNLELVAVDYGGHNLMHFWCDSATLEWHGPTQISRKALVPIFSGNPSMIRSKSGNRGNFEVVVPRAEGGFSYYWRDNDSPELSWEGPVDFAADAGIFDSAALIQSNFGEPGNLELVASSGEQLVFFWRDGPPSFDWHGPNPIGSGVSANPSLIQSTFGSRGNFELVVPMSSSGLAYYWRDNDDPHLHWYGPLTFGMTVGRAEGVALIQSNFGDPGHLEMVAQAQGQLAFFWRDSGPDFRWNGPQLLAL